MSRHSFHIGLMIDALSGYGHRILEGIGRYAKQKPEWRFAFFDRGQSDLATLVRSWNGDAIICTALDDRFSNAARGRDIPVVNVTGRVSRSNMIDVIGDAHASGVMAAEFLMARGFRHFAMVGDKDEAAYSVERMSGFVETLSAAGLRTHTFNAGVGDESRLDAWISSLPRPLALAATADRHASLVIDSCWRVGISVPEEIAVLGIGNYRQLCELSSPTLSSLEVNMERRGFEAANVLDRVLTGGEIPKKPLLIPPAHVVERESTNIYAFEDREVVAALQFIRQNASRSINVRDVVAATNISRRSLEGRFNNLIGRTLHDEIWQAHFDLASRLLASGDHPLQEIATRSGFRSASALVNLFRQRYGVTPKEYRIANRI
jgi:LacI family transcriptional regulator